MQNMFDIINTVEFIGGDGIEIYELWRQTLIQVALIGRLIKNS